MCAHADSAGGMPFIGFIQEELKIDFQKENFVFKLFLKTIIQQFFNAEISSYPQ